MINMLTQTSSHIKILAGTSVGNNGADTFLSTSVGKLFTAGLGAFGFLVVVYAIYSVVKGVAKSGFGSKEMKTIAAAAFLATFCFNPALVGTLIDGFSTVIGPIAESIKGFISGGQK